MQSTSPPRVIRHPKSTIPQREFWSTPGRYRCLVGGVGSGKSHAGAVEVLRQPRGTTGAVVAPTYTMMADSSAATLLELCEAAGVLRSYNRSKMVLKLAGDRTVLLRSADRPDKLRGLNLSWFWLDEGAMMLPSTWDIMIARLRRWPERGWITTTPRGRNWVHAAFTTDDPDYRLIVAPTRTNPFLSERYIASMEAKYDENFAAQELLGVFLDDPAGKLIWPSWLDSAAVLQYPVDPFDHQSAIEGPRRISCDPSEGRGADNAVILVRDDRQVLHLEASNVMGPAAIAARIDQLRHEWQVPPGKITVDGGGGCGRDLVLSLKKHGVHPTQVFGGGSGGARFFNLRSAAGWRLREALQSGGFGLARCGSHLPALRAELAAITYRKAGDRDAIIKKEDLHKVLGHSPDYFDALAQSFALT